MASADTNFGCLRLITDNGVIIKEYNLQPGTFTIGSGLTDKIRLTKDSNGLLRNNHCSVQVAEDGSATLIRRAIFNPALLNNEPIGKESLLKDGDQIKVIQATLEYINNSSYKVVKKEPTSGRKKKNRFILKTPAKRTLRSSLRLSTPAKLVAVQGTPKLDNVLFKTPYTGLKKTGIGRPGTRNAISTEKKKSLTQGGKKSQSTSKIPVFGSRQKGNDASTSTLKTRTRIEFPKENSSVADENDASAIKNVSNNSIKPQTKDVTKDAVTSPKRSTRSSWRMEAVSTNRLTPGTNTPNDNRKSLRKSATVKSISNTPQTDYIASPLVKIVKKDVSVEMNTHPNVADEELDLKLICLEENPDKSTKLNESGLSSVLSDEEESSEKLKTPTSIEKSKPGKRNSSSSTKMLRSRSKSIAGASFNSCTEEKENVTESSYTKNSTSMAREPNESTGVQQPIYEDITQSSLDDEDSNLETTDTSSFIFESVSERRDPIRQTITVFQQRTSAVTPKSDLIDFNSGTTCKKGTLSSDSKGSKGEKESSSGSNKRKSKRSDVLSNSTSSTDSGEKELQTDFAQDFERSKPMKRKRSISLYIETSSIDQSTLSPVPVVKRKNSMRKSKCMNELNNISGVKELSESGLEESFANVSISNKNDVSNNVESECQAEELSSSKMQSGESNVVSEASNKSRAEPTEVQGRSTRNSKVEITPKQNNVEMSGLEDLFRTPTTTGKAFNRSSLRPSNSIQKPQFSSVITIDDSVQEISDTSSSSLSSERKRKSLSISYRRKSLHVSITTTTNSKNRNSDFESMSPLYEASNAVKNFIDEDSSVREGNRSNETGKSPKIRSASSKLEQNDDDEEEGSGTVTDNTSRKSRSNELASTSKLQESSRQSKIFINEPLTPDSTDRTFASLNDEHNTSGLQCVFKTPTITSTARKQLTPNKSKLLRSRYDSHVSDETSTSSNNDHKSIESSGGKRVTRGSKRNSSVTASNYLSDTETPKLTKDKHDTTIDGRKIRKGNLLDDMENGQNVGSSQKDSSNSKGGNTPTVPHSAQNVTTLPNIKQLFATIKDYQSPLNNLSDFRGVRRLLSPNLKEEETDNNLSDFRGVRRLLSPRPKEQSPENNLSNFGGVRRLLSPNPKEESPDNNLSDLRGVKRLFSPKPLEKTSRCDYSNVAGVKQLMKTLKVQKSPKNDLTNIPNIRALYEGEKVQKSPSNDLSDFGGVKRLFSPRPNEKVTESDYSNVAGVKRMFKETEAESLRNPATYSLQELFKEEKCDDDSIFPKRIRTYSRSSRKSTSVSPSSKTSHHSPLKDYQRTPKMDVEKWVENQAKLLQEQEVESVKVEDEGKENRKPARSRGRKKIVKDETESQDVPAVTTRSLRSRVKVTDQIKSNEKQTQIEPPQSEIASSKRGKSNTNARGRATKTTRNKNKAKDEPSITSTEHDKEEEEIIIKHEVHEDEINVETPTRSTRTKTTKQIKKEGEDETNPEPTSRPTRNKNVTKPPVRSTRNKKKVSNDSSFSDSVDLANKKQVQNEQKDTSLVSASSKRPTRRNAKSKVQEVAKKVEDKQSQVPKRGRGRRVKFYDEKAAISLVENTAFDTTGNSEVTSPIENDKAVATKTSKRGRKKITTEVNQEEQVIKKTTTRKRTLSAEEESHDKTRSNTGKKTKLVKEEIHAEETKIKKNIAKTSPRVLRTRTRK